MSQKAMMNELIYNNSTTTDILVGVVDSSSKIVSTISNSQRYDDDDGGEGVGGFFSNLIGYSLGFASLMLYTPIGIRIYRQKTANGTTITTWWLKVLSYTVSDIYSYLKQYPLSTYIEVLTITIEAMSILVLVAYYQNKLYTTHFGLCLMIYTTVAFYFLIVAPPLLVAASTLTSAGLNSAALIPQFYLNYQEKTKGDYSPITASLAGTGCLIRLWTTHQLADDDIILYINFGIAFILNWCLFTQIIYYGTQYEKLSFSEVFSADVVIVSSSSSSGGSAKPEERNQHQQQEFIELKNNNNNR